ncbi:MAG TPA: GntR family transcriptional regulator [Streptosporangiaceae bacterium]
MEPEGAGLALYNQVADRLRGQILQGELAAGHRLGTEAELTAELGVSRVTLRKAIAVLREEGLVVSRQGVGTFVQRPRASQVLDHLETLDATLARQGYEPVTRVIAFGFTKPGSAIRTALALGEDDEILSVRRVHSVADGPIGVVDLAVPAQIGRMLSRHEVEHRPFYDLLPAYGIRVGPARQVIRAGAASQEFADVSGLAEGEPVLVCERLTFDSENQPIIHATFIYRSDRFEFHVSLADGPAATSWVPSGLAVTGG